MSVIEIIEISSDEDDDASTLVDVSLEKTDDIDVQQYNDGRITKTQSQYNDVNNTEIIDSLYLIKKLLNSNTKVINNLIEQNKVLSSTNGSISQANDENLELYANRYENNIADSLSHVKIVKIESLNAQENLTADIIDSHSDNDVQEVIPDSNIQSLGHGSMNEINFENIEETTNDICHPESSIVIETSVKNKFPLFKWKDLKEISNNKLQTKIISDYTLKILKKYLPLVRLDRISVPESNINSSSNAENNITPSSSEENNIISISNVENNIIPSSNVENNIIPSSSEENNIISISNIENNITSSNVENNIIPSNNAENDIISVNTEENNITSSNAENVMIPISNAENNIISSSNIENHIISSSNAENNCYCKECNCFVGSAKEFESHKQYRHNGRKLYNCEQCDYASNYKANFVRHKKTHSSERPYQCFCCSFTFTYRKTFKSHLFTHIDKNLSCDICHEKFTKANSLITHIIYYHSFSPSVRARQCKVCRELFPDRYSLKIHTETHKNGSLFKCNICCYTTKSLKILLKHVKKHVSNKIICNDCGRSLANKNKFKRHWYLRHNFVN